MITRWTTFFGFWQPIRSTLRLWSFRAATRQQLRDLDDRLLRDIGRSEGERRHECAKWFWQG